MGAKIKLDRVFVEVGGELEMVADLLGQAGLQVSLRKAFEELPERVVLAGGTIDRMRLRSVGSMAAW